MTLPFETRISGNILVSTLRNKTDSSKIVQVLSDLSKASVLSGEELLVLLNALFDSKLPNYPDVPKKIQNAKEFHEFYNECYTNYKKNYDFIKYYKEMVAMYDRVGCKEERFNLRTSLRNKYYLECAKIEFKFYLCAIVMFYVGRDYAQASRAFWASFPWNKLNEIQPASLADIPVLNKTLSYIYKRIHKELQEFESRSIFEEYFKEIHRINRNIDFETACRNLLLDWIGLRNITEERWSFLDILQLYVQNGKKWLENHFKINYDARNTFSNDYKISLQVKQYIHNICNYLAVFEMLSVPEKAYIKTLFISKIKSGEGLRYVLKFTENENGDVPAITQTLEQYPLAQLIKIPSKYIEKISATDVNLVIAMLNEMEDYFYSFARFAMGPDGWGKGRKENPQWSPIIDETIRNRKILRIRTIVDYKKNSSKNKK